MARTPHLLIVDDDREIRSLLSGFMTRNGFRVTAVPDARQAIQTLANGRVDLALVDIMEAIKQFAQRYLSDVEPTPPDAPSAPSSCQ